VINSVLVDDNYREKIEEGIVEVETEYGPLQVTIEGDIKAEHIIITYHDIGLNHETCFRRFFNQARRRYDVFKEIAVVHIDAPGQQKDARELSNEISYLDMEVLASQIEKVVTKLEIKSFFAFGVGAGAYILGLYATRYPARVKGLILVGAMAKKCGWIEWRHKWYALIMNKIFDGKLKEYFLWRWFSSDTLENNRDLVDFYSTELDRFHFSNLVKFVHGYQRRKDFTAELKKIKCQALFFSGDLSWQEQETIEVSCNLKPQNTEFTRFKTGLSVIIEDPVGAVEPIRLMFRGMGIGVLH